MVSPMTRLFLHFTFPPFSSIGSSRDAERIEPLGIAASTYTDGSQSRIVQSGVSPGVRRERGRQRFRHFRELPPVPDGQHATVATHR